jgi:hypothetical protein
MYFEKKWINPASTYTYQSWVAMITRCCNKKSTHYYNYGGRGISICDRWKNNYDNFFEDMRERPDKTTLDRIDNKGNYEPTNCRWATYTQQNNNSRRNRILNYNGESLTLAQWAAKTGVSAAKIRERLTRNVSMEKALSSESLLKKWKHGTQYAYYKYKCRCDFCLEFSRSKAKEYRKKIKYSGHNKPINEEYHGTSTGYKSYSCRCDKCKEYMREKTREYYLRKLKRSV